MSPQSGVQSTLSQAIEAAHGGESQGEEAQRSRKAAYPAEPASSANTASGVTDKPVGMEECLARAADKAFEKRPG